MTHLPASSPSGSCSVSSRPSRRSRPSSGRAHLPWEVARHPTGKTRGRGGCPGGKSVAPVKGFQAACSAGPRERTGTIESRAKTTVPPSQTASRGTPYLRASAGRHPFSGRVSFPSDLEVARQVDRRGLSAAASRNGYGKRPRGGCRAAPDKARPCSSLYWLQVALDLRPTVTRAQKEEDRHDQRYCREHDSKDVVAGLPGES